MGGDGGFLCDGESRLKCPGPEFIVQCILTSAGLWQDIMRIQAIKEVFPEIDFQGYLVTSLLVLNQMVEVRK